MSRLSLSLSLSESSPGVLSAATTPPSDSDYVDTPPHKDEEDHSSVTAITEMSEQARYDRLAFLLEKSSAYTRLLKDRMDVVKVKSLSESVEPDNTKPAQAGRKRGRNEVTKNVSKRQKVQGDKDSGTNSRDEGEPKFLQPQLITGATLKDYQLEGVAWMVSLYENGISGILADEMGLGKTLQTIAFHAFLRERVSSPFLVVCPLSVLHNWIDEFHKFAPSIPVCMYHGTPEERKELRRTVMRPPVDDDEDGKLLMKRKAKPKPRRKAASRRKSGKRKTLLEESEEDEAEEKVDSWEEEEFVRTTQPLKDFPVVVTTYEMIIKDRQHLANYKWGYIVVDEGHRLKNFDCKLMQEIKKYESAGRMILTGTPLHNNLGELWSLLNFILPDIFGDLSSFQEWFNLPTMQSNLSSEQSSHIISTLHSILKPFLLRRLKVDVEQNLPPKKEYLLYAPLTERQRSVYQAVLDGGIRGYLIKGKQMRQEPAETQTIPEEVEEEVTTEGRKLRKTKPHRYDVDGDDDEYFEYMESGGYERDEENRRRDAEQSMMEIGAEYHRKVAVRQVNNLRLQNTVMQLRKVCSHPFLFDWPVDSKTQEPILNEELVGVSGKMMVLDRLLCELFKRGHKVLLFSQFTTMLDIIEDWAIEFKGWSLCRIDGKSKPMERREQMNRFQTGGDAPDAPCLFLLSTRAGGLGINLTAADTVIFYDQDWNPQMDIQAQDRAHRIGQTKPVLIFRLLSAHTIETTIMTKANEKRKLEALVIAKGKFKMPGTLATSGKESMAELAASLLKLEGEKIDVVPDMEAGKANVLSDEDLDVLLDRSPAVFADRGEGWARTVATDGREETKRGNGRTMGKKKAFEVFAGRADETNDTLAKMLGEED